MSEAGKGDRPRKVDRTKFEDNWDKIFGVSEPNKYNADSDNAWYKPIEFYKAYSGDDKDNYFHHDYEDTSTLTEVKDERMVHTTNFELAGDFMEAYGQDIPVAPKWPDAKIQNLRLALIDEEVGELRQALQDKDMVEVADALVDILYVVYGAGHAFGLDLDECYNEVHRSNMTKLGQDGYPMKDDDGKVMKGPNYEEPNLSQFLTGFPERFS